MKSNTKDEMQGQFHEGKGNLKRKAGEMATARLEAERRIEPSGGKVGRKVGRLKKGSGK